MCTQAARLIATVQASHGVKITSRSWFLLDMDDMSLR
jgi:hypothetical protein